ncbi:hypothetical protein [Haladaptatus sp. NG-WS-4]
MSADERADEPVRDERRTVSTALTYGAPFLGTLLVAVGIAGGILGGYAAAQAELGLCGNPTIVVYTPATSDQYTDSQTGPALERLRVGELTPAERRAFEEAIGSPRGEAEVRGRFVHRPAFSRGVLVTNDGTIRYATITSTNPCLFVDPLLFPLGVVSILLGVLGILTPPLYRRVLEREQRKGRPPR